MRFLAQSSATAARVAVALAVAAAAFIGGTHLAHAMRAQPGVSMHTMQVGGMTRTYEEFSPLTPLPKSAPIIVMLQGSGATLSLETGRDHLIPYAQAGKAEVIYPVPYDESWNAIGCCQVAAAQNVNDIGFLQQLVARVDPGHAHPIDLVGYSNGGRLAYRMACNYPGVFNQIAVVKADPEPGCDIEDPQDILQISATDDTYVPFKPGDKGTETPPATVQNAALRAADGCPGDGQTIHPGKTLSVTWWTDCADGTRLGFAVYTDGGHNFPPPTSTQPAAAQVIWAFFTDKTSIAPLPKVSNNRT